MFDLFNVVRIKHNGIVGTIVDKTIINGKTMYIVENNQKGKIKGAYGGDWAEFDCSDEDLEPVSAQAVSAVPEYAGSSRPLRRAYA